jgi:hypothetical protein
MLMGKADGKRGGFNRCLVDFLGLLGLLGYGAA